MNQVFYSLRCIALRAKTNVLPVLLLLATASCSSLVRSPEMDIEPLSNPASQDSTSAPAGNNTEETIARFRQRSSANRGARNVPTIAEWFTGPAAGVTLNFQNADIETVAQALLRDALGLSYIIDEGVAGKMTLQTEGSLSREALLFIFEAALDGVGVHLREEGGAYTLLSENRTTQLGNAPIVGLSAADMRAGYGLHAVQLDFLTATQLQSTLEGVVGGQVRLRADTRRNILLVEGTGPDRLNAVRLAKTFDVDWMKGRSYALVPLEVADVTLVIRELEQVFETGNGQLAQGLLQFLPIERMNALLVIGENDALVTRAEEWIARLDSGSQNGGRRLYTYRVQHGRASDLAAVIGSLYGAQQQATSVGAGRSVAPGLQAGFTTGGAQAAQSNQSAQSFGQPNIQARTAQPVIAFVSDSMRIVADERKNALLIMTTPGEYDLIRSTLKRLDVAPLQVLIEATIVEVTLNDELEFGVQWFLQNGDFNFSLAGGNSRSNIQPTTIPGFSGVFDDLEDARVVVSALDSVTNVEMLSAPQLMVLNNQTALVQFGDEIPVPSASAVNLDADTDRVFNEITYRSTGIILKVTPRVNESGTVLLDIEQEVSDVAETVSSGIDAPTVQQRRIVSSVVVQSGETLALGGLIQTSNTQIESGVPLLSQIPLIGNAFKNTQDKKNRSELLILVTPRLVGSVEQARAVTTELRDRMLNARDLYRRDE